MMPSYTSLATTTTTTTTTTTGLLIGPMIISTTNK